jgi:predicted ATPase
MAVVLHALGQCAIRTEETTITPRADVGFALAAHLIAERGKRVPRTALLTMFWPTVPIPTASHTLNEALRKLRRKGVPICSAETRSVYLPRGIATTDIEQLARDTPRDILEYDLTILPGYAPNGSPRFQDWLDNWRRSLCHRLVESLLAAMDRAMVDNDWPTIIGLAARVLDLEPGNQDALAATANAAPIAHRRRTPYPVRIQSPPVRAASRGSSSVSQVREQYLNGRWKLPEEGFPAARDTPIVGRDHDVANLKHLFDPDHRNAATSAFIYGPAGIGKSRLARELMVHARMEGMAVASVTCQHSDVHRPLSVFVDVVPQVREFPGAAGCSPAMVPYLDRLTRHDPEDPTSTVDEHETDYRYTCVRQAVFDLFEAVSEEQPLVLVVENVQWLDALSWSLLRDMTQWATGHPVLFIFTSREPWNRDSSGEPYPSTILHALSSLDDSAASRHAADYARAIGNPPPPALMQWCIAASEGNPYFLEELLNHWVVTGEQFSAPPSLTSLLNARLDRLAPFALHVLQTCAILGKNSTLSRVERALSYPYHALFAALEELGTAGMITAVRDEHGSGNNRALCRHDVLAQAAVDRLSPSGLASLHARAGDILEAELCSPDSASLLWDCAEHWYAAGNSVHAVGLGRSCITHLLEIGLGHDAADACRNTLGFCTNESDRIGILTTLAHVLHLTRSWNEIPPVLEEIHQHRRATDTDQLAHDDIELLGLDVEWHVHRDWHSTLQSALRCVMASDADASHRVRAGIVALKVATDLGQTATMHEIYQVLSPLARESSVSELDLLPLEMIYHAICGDCATSAASARSLLDYVSAREPDLVHLCTRLNCAAALCRAGHFSEGEHEHTVIFERALQLGAHNMAAEISQHLLQTYLDIGAMDAAEAWAHRCINLPHLGAIMQGQRTLRLALARIELWRGHPDAADHLLRDGSNPLWDDPVTMFQAAALATKLHIEIARESGADVVARLVTRLEPLNDRLRPIGGQDFETFALYAGMKHCGRDEEAVAFLYTYITQERRDPAPLRKEIAAEVARLAIDVSDSTPTGA